LLKHLEVLEKLVIGGFKLLLQSGKTFSRDFENFSPIG
jgi:hypothetical protein